MSGIVLSSAIRASLSTLQSTADLQSRVQERLATGRKVNSALDNPTNFFTASGLNRRSNDLASLLDGMSNGIKTLEAADNAMKSITRTVETMQANVRSARQDKSFKGISYTYDTATIGTVTAKNLSFVGGAVGAATVNVALNTADVGGSRTTQQTTAAYAAPTAAALATYTAQAAYATPGAVQALTIAFNGGSTDVSLTTANTTIASAITTINTAIAADADSTGKFEAYDNAGRLAIRSIGNVDGNITVTGAGETAIFGTQVTTTGSDGLTTFTVNGTAVTLTTAQNNVAAAVTKANADLGAAHAFEAYDNAGNLQFRAKANGATALTIAGADAGLFAAAVLGTAPTTAGSVKTIDQLASDINNHASLKDKLRASNDGGKLRIENLSTESLTVTGASATTVDGAGASSNTIGGNEVRKNLISQFNELRRQLDKLAADGSYNGINLLRADKLKITFNEFGTSNVEVQAKDVNGTVRAISTETNSLDITEAAAAEFSSDTLLDSRLSALADSLTIVQTQASSFGANLATVQIRQEFTRSMINTLQSGADNLTLADSNEEGANLLALNTRQQLSQTALSLASQASQAVLRLF